MRVVKRYCELPGAAGSTAAAVDPTTRLYFAIRDLAVLSNPFAFLGSKEWNPQPTTITPGAPMLIYKHTGASPVLVVMQARGTTNAQKGYLFVAASSSECTLAAATAVDYDTGPKLSVVLGPNEEVWADVTDPDVAGGATVQLINWAAIPLHDLIRDF